jgi:S-DNA-T family DNA segregation ATPase FtsK/SpoIIIE
MSQQVHSKLIASRSERPSPGTENRTLKTEMLDYRRIREDLFALSLFGVIVFVGLSLCSYSPSDPPASTVYPPPDVIHNLCGPVGAKVAHALITATGVCAWLILLGLISVDAQLFSRAETKDRFSRWFGGAMIMFAVCMGAQMLTPGLYPGTVYGSGGYLGALGTTVLLQEFSWAGSLILLVSMCAAGLLLSSEAFIIRCCVTVLSYPAKFIFKRFAPIWHRFQERRAARRAASLERKRQKAE